MKVEPKIKKFHSKILLFGEYSIIRESMGLALPYQVFEGHLCHCCNTTEVDSEIHSMLLYLKDLQQGDGDRIKKYSLLSEFNIDLFEKEVMSGLRFISSIPQGYGLGSSGALCAALLDRYAYSVSHESSLEFSCERLQQLKQIFSVMESHFHGASSGIDPLISYCNHPLLIRSKNDLQWVDIPHYGEGEGAIFLLNTKRDRRTEPLVNLFLEKCKSTSFENLCQNVLKPITNNCIESFLKMNKETLFEFFRELSDFQYRHFAPMIPKHYRQLWKNGLKHEQYYLKLCGAGGGGFILGICLDFQQAQECLVGQELRPLFFL